VLDAPARRSSLVASSCARCSQRRPLSVNDERRQRPDRDSDEAAVDRVGAAVSIWSAWSAASRCARRGELADDQTTAWLVVALLVVGLASACASMQTTPFLCRTGQHARRSSERHVEGAAASDSMQALARCRWSQLGVVEGGGGVRFAFRRRLAACASTSGAARAARRWAARMTSARRVGARSASLSVALVRRRRSRIVLLDELEAQRACTRARSADARAAIWVPHRRTRCRRRRATNEVERRDRRTAPRAVSLSRGARGRISCVTIHAE
jgi:hypothetical protein